MSQLEQALFSCEQLRTCEQDVPHLYPIAEQQLMSQAGTEAFFFVLNHYPHVRHLVVFCGSGNNAGDGYVLARLAHQHGLSVAVHQCKPIEELPLAAHHAALEALASGVEFQSADEPIDADAELIVDALLGIGLKGVVHGVLATAMSQINGSGLPVLSLDIPSGLNADTGQADSLCVKASMTLSFIALKAGMYTLDGPDYCGDIYSRHLQLESYLERVPAFATLLHESNLSYSFLKRRKNAHKGDFGHVLVIGGGLGMPGAVALAAKAALRVGAGAVSIATRPEHVCAVLPVVPEAMVWGVNTAKELEPLLNKASFCIIGPGLGECDWAQALFEKAISSQLPMLIDASALRLLADAPQTDDNWILTPHPGEASHLLGCTSAAVQENRYMAASAIQQQYGGVLVLKGVGTLIQTLDKGVFVCPKGNPAMASAGMGDVLSGIIAGFCAQGASLSEAAKLGVWVHAAAADLMVQNQGQSGLIASDLLTMLPKVVSCIYD